MARIIRETDSARFGKMITSSIISSIFTVLLGVAMFFFSEQVEVLFGYLVGALFVFEGIITASKYFKRDGAKLYSFNLIFGIIMLILGLLIIFAPRSIVSLITVCVALFLIVLGANKITYGVWLKVGSDASWLITFFIGLMIITFGVLIMLNPFSASLTNTKIIGVFLVLSGILDFTDSILLKKQKDEIVKIFW